jgi:hypothetical protein
MPMGSVECKIALFRATFISYGGEGLQKGDEIAGFPLLWPGFSPKSGNVGLAVKGESGIKKYPSVQKVSNLWLAKIHLFI